MRGKHFVIGKIGFDSMKKMQYNSIESGCIVSVTKLILPKNMANYNHYETADVLKQCLISHWFINANSFTKHKHLDSKLFYY